jgi:hypothetical protein
MDDASTRPVAETKAGDASTAEPEGTPPASVDAAQRGSKDSRSASDPHRKKGRRPLSSFEKWTLILGGIGIFVAAGTGIAVAWQARISALTLDEIKKGGTDTHDLAVAAKAESDKMANVSAAADKIRQAAQDMVVQDQRIADNAKNSLAASNGQSKAALEATVESSHRDQRAWVTFSGFKLSGEPELNTGVTVTITVNNTGKTPALEFVNQSNLLFLNVEPPGTNFALPTNPRSRAMVAPGTFGVQFTSDPLTLKSLPQISLYTSGTYKIYLEALVRYKDTFNQSHWTRACAYHVYSARLDDFQFCEHGNEVDQGN